MMYFPNALPREHRSGRTVAPITTRDHMMIGESRDRRSLLVLPTPISEDAYEYPVSITREPVYIAPDVRPPLANQKTSVTDLVRAFVGEDMWEDLTVEADHFAQYFTMPIRVATHLHKVQHNPGSVVCVLIA